MLGKISVRDLHGPWSDFMDKLQSEDSEKWFSAFKKFLREENPWPKLCVFPIWKTIRLGTGLNTANDFREAIKTAGMYIGNWANDILGKPTFTAGTKEEEVDLVVVSNADLGFKDGAKLKDTYARALELGLELCLNEVGPQLRLQYTNQPNDEWLLLAMEPIVGSGDDRELFSVGRDDLGKQYLSGDYGNLDVGWNADTRFVFRRRRKAP